MAKVANNTVAAFADNVRRLMLDLGLKQEALGKRAGVSQRAISDLLNYGRLRKSPTLRTIHGISVALDVEVWTLFIADMPIDLLRGHRVSKLVENYRDAPEEGRTHVDRIAESEIRYAATEKVIAQKG